jgi:acetyl-CoA acetyltransferase
MVEMRDVWIRGAAMTPFGKHLDRSARDLVEQAVAAALRVTAIGELFVCGELGIFRPGEAARVMADRETWLGGRLPVNPSGGLLARGHPLGATGLAQIVELTWQLEGRCGPRQVESARAAFADNIGGWIGSDVGAGVMHVLVR